MMSLAEGFGFNTNLLETNILNLAVVLPLVFSLGKDTLTKILDLRKEQILESLRNADDRFKQAQLKLDAAKSAFAGAGETVNEIQREGEKAKAALRLEETRLYEELDRTCDTREKEAIRLAEEKITTAFRDDLISQAFALVTTEVTAFTRDLNISYKWHQKCINDKIVRVNRDIFKMDSSSYQELDPDDDDDDYLLPEEDFSVSGEGLSYWVTYSFNDE
jgi:F-type H+-transporting ATPase subunit b